MEIRDALTDDYLARFFDPGTLARAHGYLDEVFDLAAVHETSTSLTATAEVWGTAPAPYRVQFHAEVNEASDWVFTACSCPVARLCKHGAAVALRLRGAAQPPPEPEWRQRLARLTGELEKRAHSTLAGTGLGLEVSRRPANRWSRGAPGDFSMRPVRPGARRGWVRSGAEWTDLSGPVATSRFVPAQVEALQALHRGLLSRHTYLVAGAAPMLDDYGDRLVPALRAAVAAGVVLVPGAGGRIGLAELRTGTPRGRPDASRRCGRLRGLRGGRRAPLAGRRHHPRRPTRHDAGAGRGRRRPAHRPRRAAPRRPGRAPGGTSGRRRRRRGGGVPPCPGAAGPTRRRSCRRTAPSRCPLPSRPACSSRWPGTPRRTPASTGSGRTARRAARCRPRSPSPVSATRRPSAPS